PRVCSSWERIRFRPRSGRSHPCGFRCRSSNAQPRPTIRAPCPDHPPNCAGREADVSAFWDHTAALLLCTDQPRTGAVRKLLPEHAPVVVWWGTPTKIRNVLTSLFREQTISRSGLDQALGRLGALMRYWHEVLPTDRVRLMGEELLDAHALRTSDALELG